MKAIALVAGTLLLIIVLHDGFEVMLLPRRVRRQLRLVRIFFHWSWAIWSGVGRKFVGRNGRSQFFSFYGPLSMVVLLMVWGIALIIGFGMIQWGLNAGFQPSPGLGNQLYFSGVTFFTLGYGDVVPHTRFSKIFAVLEAGTGLGFIAVVIGVLVQSS